MGRAIDYCTVCGDQVPASDLEKGKAVEVAEKVYCAKCKAQAPAVAAAPSNGRKRTGSTGTFPAVRPVGGQTGRIPPIGSGGHRAVGPGTTRLSHVPIEEAMPEPKGKGPLVAAGIAGAVLLGAIVVFAVQNSQENAARDKETKRKADAEAAFKECVDFRRAHPDDADGLLKLIDASTAKVRNTDWSGKLAAERDDAVNLQKKIAIHKERAGRFEALRTRKDAAKTVAELTALLGDIEKLKQEMDAPGGDPDVAKDTFGLIRSAKERRINVAFDDAKNFEAQNSDKFEEAIEKWSSALMLCEAGFETYAKQSQERMTGLKTKREDAARADWEPVKTKVAGLRSQKKYDDCQKEIRAFTDKWKSGAAVDEAGKLAWEIKAEADAAASGNGNGNPVRPDPSKVPPKDWTTLFDEKNRGDFRTGGSNKVPFKFEGGTLVGTNPLTAADAAQDKQNNGIGFWYTNKAYAGYELQVEFTLVKGSALFIVGIGGIDANPPAIPLNTVKDGDKTQVVLAADKPYSMTVTVRSDSIAINGAGLTGGNWKYQNAGDGKDHGSGAFGFALNPGCEVRVRLVKIRAIP